MTPQQRRAMRLANPLSFLNVTLSPEDVAEPVSNEQLLLLARQSLDKIVATGAFETAADPALYLYRLRSESHEQTGLVADIPVADYVSGAVRIHEQVRERRAQLLGEHIFQLGISSSPIALAYRNTTDLARLIEHGIAQTPTLSISPDFGIEQTIWRITDPATVSQFQSRLKGQTLYIIDGHHRAAASLAAYERAPSEQSSRLFGVMFPHDSLRLRGFNRYIKQCTAGDLQRLTDAIGKLGGTSGLYQSPVCGETSVYMAKQWWSVPLRGTGFDSQKLFDQILAPCFKLTAADAPDIVNVPASDDVLDLQSSVERAGSAGFVLAPLSIEQFMDAADQQILLPPKSTYFVPKAQSGVFLRYLRS